MYPELIIHIGTHKTGTTSIQTSTDRNTKDLKKHGPKELWGWGKGLK